MQNGHSVGPIDDSSLRQMFSSGQLVASTMVWREGMAQWMPAAQCGLAGPVGDPSTFQAQGAPPPVGVVGDTTGGIIPYKNPKALTSYYMGVGALIPCLGLFLGPAAIFLGLQGLAYGKANPVVKGIAHAWVGIVLGSLSSLFNWGFALIALVSSVSR